MPGALEFLTQVSASLPIFIVSGTPEKELLDLIRARGLEKYVSGAYGSPSSKDQILKGILTTHRWLPDEILFVGDSALDYEAAQTAGVFFIGRVSDQSRNPFQETSVRTVKDFVDLSNLWPTLLSEKLSIKSN